MRAEWVHECPRCGRRQVMYVPAEVRCGNAAKHPARSAPPVMRVVSAPKKVAA